ncbi:MAG TPA: hypothetical protein PK156_16595 [Polyangium sp.]|nr:hypothetical protein [Polyangium sp.]
MNASAHACFVVGLSLLLASCGNPPNAANVPDEPSSSSTDDAPVIVLGRPGAVRAGAATNSPLQVAEQEPQNPALSPVPAPRTVDAELSDLVRDPRLATWAPRASQLLITELQTLEMLLSSQGANGPDRPILLRRLGDSYYELKTSARQEKHRALQSGRATSRDIDRPEKLATAAQKKFLQYYEMLVDKYPNHCQRPNPADPTKSQGCLDDVLYFLALEYQRLDTPDQARKYFLKLIQAYPVSPWVPSAYLAFGEFFLAEGADDPSKYVYAQQAYDKVTQYPPPQNETYGFANYRLGQVFVHRQDFTNALLYMTKAIDFSVNFSTVRGSDLLGGISRREIVPIYAQAGTPRKAEAFFKRLANDPPGSNEHLVMMLDALVMAYLHENKRVEAADVCYSFSGGSAALPSCGQVKP